MRRPPCDICGKPIPVGQACLCIKTAKAWRRYEEQQEFEARLRERFGDGAIDLRDLDGYPEPERWRWTHLTCGDEDYVIREHRINTPAKALRWTLHLMEKVWFGATDWEWAMYRLGLVEETNNE